MRSSVVGKPNAEINSPVVAVGNNNADRELIGSLGFKCRFTPAADYQRHIHGRRPLTKEHDAEAALTEQDTNGAKTAYRKTFVLYSEEKGSKSSGLSIDILQ